MELALLGVASVAGYLSTQSNRINYFKKQNNRHLQKQPYPTNVYNAQGYPTINYPMNHNMGPYEFNHNPNVQLNQNLQNAQETLKKMNSIENFENSDSSQDVMNSQDMPNIFNNSNSYKGPSDPRNNGVNTFLTDTNQRSIGDFSHNNMVPNIKKITQNMNGTGMSQGDIINGYDVDTGADKTGAFQRGLNSFTGTDDTYLHKREAGPMFSPAEQQTNWVYGAPLLRPDEGRYTIDLTKRHDLKPTEQIMVGPGLNLDPSVPASGGLHEFTRVMPNNVSDYKANQLEGRINAGKYHSSGLPTSYPGVGSSANSGPVGVPKNRPPKFYSQARIPTMSNKAGFVNSAPLVRPDYTVDERPKNGQREQISYGYGTIVPKQNVKEEFCMTVPDTIGIAPSRPGMNVSQRSPTYMSQDNNIRSKYDCNSLPLNAPSYKNQGQLINNYYVNETDRGEINPMNESPLNLKGQDTGLSYKFTDMPKTTLAETLEFSYTGDANNSKKGATFYTYTDAPRVTDKETTQYSYVGDANNSKKGATFYTYEDPMKTTLKETTSFSYAGDANNSKKGAKFYTYDDAPRATIKQSTNFDYSGIANTGKSVFTETSRFQFTGPDKNIKESFANTESLKGILSSLGGADTYTVRGSTLVENYVPGAGRSNIRQDAENLFGKFNPKMSDSNTNGPGTLVNSLPDASKYQNNRFLAVPKPSPNKLIDVNYRDTASYANQQLKENPLSMWSNNKDGEIPRFFQSSNPDSFGEFVATQEDKSDDFMVEDGGMPVYPKNGNILSDPDNKPNTNIVYNNQSEDVDYNPLIDLGSDYKVNNQPTFPGKAYSGNFDEANTYGPLTTLREKEDTDLGLENGPIVMDDKEYVCEPNRALYSTNGQLMLTHDI